MSNNYKLKSKGCSICLSPPEVRMLNEKINILINSNRLNAKNISGILYRLYESSELRYYRINDISSLSKNLLKDIREELGRNKSNDLTDMITARDLNIPDEENVDAENGKLIIKKSGKTKSFGDESQINVFYHNIRKKQ